MGLKAVLTAEEHGALDEGVRGVYREADDGFVLDIADVDRHPDVSGLKKSQIRALDEAKKAKKERDDLVGTFDGIDPEKAREALAKYEEWEAKGGVPDEDAIPRELHEQRVAAAKEKGTKDVAKLQEDVAQKDAIIERLAIKAELTSAIAKGGFLDEYHDDVFRALMSEGPEVVIDGGDARGIFRNDLGEAVSIADRVAVFAKSKEADKYMPASDNQGSDSKNGRSRGGTGGPNPFAKDSRNITEQMRLMKESPDQARMLAAQAGVKLPKAS